MPKRIASIHAEKLPPAQRINSERETEREFAAAKTLLRNKNYKQALSLYKQALAHAADPEAFPDPRDIEKLVKNYRPAAAAVKKWRDTKEKLICQGKADLVTIHQWSDLNECLNDRNRARTLFQRLREAGADEDTLSSLCYDVWESLVKNREYEALRFFLPTIASMTFHEIALYHASIWFPKDSFADSPEEIISEGKLVFELAVALDANLGAEKLAEKLLSVDSSDKTFAALIKAARRAKRPQQAIKLYAQARETLGVRRIRASKIAIGNLAVK